MIGGVGDFGPNGAILDDAILYAAAIGTDVFMDGFESSDTTAWPEVVP